MVSLAGLQAYVANLEAKGLSGSSRRRRVWSIKSFFGYLAESGYIANDPSKKLAPPHRDTPEPRFLTYQEYRALQEACSENVRDKAIIELLLQTGITLSEIVRLTIRDIELPTYINRDPANTGTMYIKGRGKRERILPLNYRACRALKEWLPVRPGIAESALFVTQLPTPMGEKTFRRIVGKYLERAGLGNATVRTLRHSFATHHVAKGTDLGVVQEALGHSNLKQTYIYASTAKRVMERSFQEHAL